MNPLIPIIAIVSASVYAARGVLTKNAAEKLTFTFKDVVLNNFGLLKTHLYLRFEINNPTDTPLRIQDYKLQLYYNQKPIADIVIENNQKNITPKGQTLFTLPVVLDNVSTGKEIYLAIVKGKPLQDAVIKGTLKINDFTTNINETIPIKL